jgi:hypothetical protein
MKANMSEEPSPSSPPAPDTTRRTTLYLLMAATVAAVLQIPFTAALVPSSARSGTPITDAAANAAGTILLSYVMIRLGFRASRRVWDAHAHGLGRRRLSTRRGAKVAPLGHGNRDEENGEKGQAIWRKFDGGEWR